MKGDFAQSQVIQRDSWFAHCKCDREGRERSRFFAVLMDYSFFLHNKHMLNKYVHHAYGLYNINSFYSWKAKKRPHSSRSNVPDACPDVFDSNQEAMICALNYLMGCVIMDVLLESCQTSVVVSIKRAQYISENILVSIDKIYMRALCMRSTICPFVKLIRLSLHCNPAHLLWPVNGTPNHVRVAAPFRLSDGLPSGEILGGGGWGGCRAAASFITDVMSAQIWFVTVPVNAHCKRKEKRWVALSAAVRVM